MKNGSKNYVIKENTVLLTTKSEWIFYQPGVAKNSDIAKLHVEIIQLPPGESKFTNSVYQAKHEAIFENLKACVIKACKSAGYTIENLSDPLLLVKADLIIKELKQKPPVSQPNVWSATTAMFIDKCV